ncbi:hypothetical protein ABFS82_06G123200 [Erythranthe guttata]|nr:PREDICTED: uncharacterized protein LOC105960330 [Erythranthe guttata]|eukprot:XP_012839948.1 PREDICTED: uncharacterized protein LOC105960330 [Erythranthe guttata]
MDSSSLRIALLVIILICAAPFQSDASFLENFRKLAKGDQMSPSPSPVQAANLPEKESCDEVPDKCDIKDFNVTACLPFVGNGSQASYMLVLNGGESSRKLNIVVDPANITLEEIVISGQQVKKINLPPNTGGNSSIALHVENKECVIQMGALLPQGFFYTSYLKPINGTYLFFVAAVFLGGIWACCKLATKRRRHLNGVAYKELEMEGPEKSDPSFVIESSDGWDQNWDGDDDDDWDEEKAVAFSPGGNITRKVSKNSASLNHVDTTQWGNDWDD